MNPKFAFFLSAAVLIGAGIWSSMFGTGWLSAITGVATSTESQTGLATSEEWGALVLGSSTVRVIVVDDSAELVRGLSGHPPLSEDEGMFFIFPAESSQAFWMKDMLFALDMIWLDRSLVIVDITENVPPESYPATFSPRVPAQYVLEVNAGYARRHGIAIGTRADVVLPDGGKLP